MCMLDFRCSFKGNNDDKPCCLIPDAYGLLHCKLSLEEVYYVARTAHVLHRTPSPERKLHLRHDARKATCG